MCRRLSFLLLLSAAVSGCSDPVAARERFLASGDTYLAQGRLNEATIEYRNAAQRDPSSVEAQQKLGETYIAMNEPGKALTAYQAVSELDRKNVAARLRAGSLLAASGDFERAAARAREAIDLDRSSVEARILLAQALAGMRRPQEAAEQLTAAIEAQPNNAAGYAALGELQLAEGHREAAEASFLQAVTADPQSPRAHLSLGEYYWVTGRLREGEASIRKALALAPREPLTRRALAMFLMANDRSAEAEEHWKFLADASADDAPRLELADYYVSTDRPNDALAVLEPLAANDTTGDASARLAAVLYEVGERDRSIAILDHELSARKSNRRALLLKAQMLMDDKKWSEAADYARRVTVLEPESWSALNLLGAAQAAAGDMAGAAESFRQVTRLNPESDTARVRLATAYAATGDPNRALLALEEGFAKEPGLSGVAANNIAWNLNKEEAMREVALTLARYATEKLPNRPEPWDTLGAVHLALGDTAAAVKAFEASVKLAPTNKDYQERLNEARRRLAQNE